MHPVANLRGTASQHLAGRRIVLGVSGSIAAVKTVELARELIRQGADVIAVMTDSATRIIHPDALEFATGNRVVTRLTGNVEHVSLLGDVPDKADLFLVAPATANTISKMALGIDDSPVTTFATVAFGTGTPVIVAPAMHEAMLKHRVVGGHQKTLVERLGVHWVEPLREEKKAKLADVDVIVERVIHVLANGRQPGSLAGKRCLVISGSTAESIDPIRVITNLSSGQSGHLIATELRRLGAGVTFWQGHATRETPPHLVDIATSFRTHGDLLRRVKKADLSGFDQVWMPAAIGDFSPIAAKHKIASDASLTLRLTPLAKVIESVRGKAPHAVFVAFKAESDASGLLAKARSRLRRYKADFVVANTQESFGSPNTTLHLVTKNRAWKFSGRKDQVLPQVVAEVARAASTRDSARRAAPRAGTKAKSVRTTASPSRPRARRTAPKGAAPIGRVRKK